MTKSTGTLLLLWILTAAAATYFWHDSSRRKVRETELQQKISQLEKDLETTRAQTQKIQDTSELKALKTELMRLRAELTQRRDVSTRLEALQLENERLIDAAQELQTELADVRAQAAAQFPEQPNTHTIESDASSTNTAMVFYLRNPELMKRYFPDLYKSIYETNQPPPPF